MGHYADRFPGKTKQVGQTFYLNTGDASNFSRKSLFDWPSVLNANFTYFIMPSKNVWNSFSLQNIFKHPTPMWKNTQVLCSANLDGRTGFRHWAMNKTKINLFVFDSSAAFSRLLLLHLLHIQSKVSVSKMLKFCTNRKVIQERDGRGCGNGKELTDSGDI